MARLTWDDTDKIKYRQVKKEKKKEGPNDPEMQMAETRAEVAVIQIACVTRLTMYVRGDKMKVQSCDSANLN